MASIINASPTNGIVQTADGSGVLKIQSNSVTTNALAWVNFAGASGTRNASYNVSSITVNSAGLYTINFTNALPDNNYVLSGTCTYDGSGFGYVALNTSASNPFTTTTAAIRTLGYVSYFSPFVVTVAVFGN